VIALQKMHGAAGGVPPDETAFAHRKYQYDCGIFAKWDAPSSSAENVSWARELWQAMEPHFDRAVYVNMLGDEGDERVRAAYGANYDRLAAIKRKSDPTNLFRLNQNILPAAVSV
jgi:hypothetical protein